MAGEHVTHSQLKEHIDPIKGDISKMLDAMMVMQRETTENSVSTRYLADSINKIMVSIEPRISELEKSDAKRETYWKGVFWAGGLFSSGLVALAVAVLS